MTRFLNKPFPFLDRFKSRLLHVFIILVFSVLFLLVFEPFNIKAWLKFPGWLKDLGLISLGLTFAFIISFSQLLVRTILRIRIFRVYHLVIWLIAEILLLSLIFTIIFADYTNGFLQEFLITMKFTSTGLALLYSFSILILVLIYQNMKLENRVSVSSTEKPDLISIKDEREKLKISINRSAVLYLESTGNYVNLFYLQEDQIKKEMVRNSMKKVVDQLDSSGLVRCHRSFIVNTENVHWFKKTGRNYQFKLKNCDTLIPVSRAFVPAIKSLIQD